MLSFCFPVKFLFGDTSESKKSDSISNSILLKKTKANVFTTTYSITCNCNARMVWLFSAFQSVHFDSSSHHGIIIIILSTTDPWKCPRPGWRGLGAPCSRGRCPCPWQKVGNSSSLRSCLTQILGFYEIKLILKSLYF